jgi:hypothetical protein
MADWETARSIAGSFPGAEESTSYGQPAFKVRRRLFAWVSPDCAVLRERIEDSWLLRAPKTLVDAYVAGAGQGQGARRRSDYDNALATNESIAAVNAFRLVSHA